MKKLLIGILLTAGLANGQTVLITEPVNETDAVVVYPKLATSAALADGLDSKASTTGDNISQTNFLFNLGIYEMTNTTTIITPDGLDLVTSLDTHVALSDSFDTAWTLVGGGVYTNEGGWAVGGGAGISTAGEVYLTSANNYILSPKTDQGFAWATLDIEQSLGTLLTYTSTDGTNFTSAISSGSNQYFKIAYDPGIGIPGVVSYLKVFSAIIYEYDQPQYFGSTYNLAGSTIFIDNGDADAEPVNYAQYKLLQSEIDSDITTFAEDATKTLRGAELRLGNMWVVSPADESGDRFIVSGGEISGDGELIGTTNDFVISKNDYPLMSFQSSFTGLVITNWTVVTDGTNDTITLYVATNGVVSQPYAETCDDLTSCEWSMVTSPDVSTYPAASNGTYTIEFSVPVQDKLFIRAVQQSGDSRTTVETDYLTLGDSILEMTDPTGGVWRVSMTTNGTLSITQ